MLTSLMAFPTSPEYLKIKETAGKKLLTLLKQLSFLDGIDKISFEAAKSLIFKNLPDILKDIYTPQSLQNSTGEFVVSPAYVGILKHLLAEVTVELGTPVDNAFVKTLVGEYFPNTASVEASPIGNGQPEPEGLQKFSDLPIYEWWRKKDREDRIYSYIEKHLHEYFFLEKNGDFSIYDEQQVDSKSSLKASTKAKLAFIAGITADKQFAEFMADIIMEDFRDFIHYTNTLKLLDFLYLECTMLTTIFSRFTSTATAIVGTDVIRGDLELELEDVEDASQIPDALRSVYRACFGLSDAMPLSSILGTLRQKHYTFLTRFDRYKPSQLALNPYYTTKTLAADDVKSLAHAYMDCAINLFPMLSPITEETLNKLKDSRGKPPRETSTDTPSEIPTEKLEGLERVLITTESMSCLTKIFEYIRALYPNAIEQMRDTQFMVAALAFDSYIYDGKITPLLDPEPILRFGKLRKDEKMRSLLRELARCYIQKPLIDSLFGFEFVLRLINTTLGEPVF